MVFLGFSAGLPFLLIAGTLTAWLTIARISMAEVGMFAWVGILYSLKFLWAPLVDRLPVPFLTRWMGRRRSWMLLAQLGVGLSVAAIAYSEPSTNLTMIAWFAVLTAFAGATQDIVIDAYRIEAVEQKVQGAMAAGYQVGYRLGLVVAGAGALSIAHYVSWRAAYQTMALLMSVGIITVLVMPDR
jgi:PAT family beta-lactamase induction signal transducer AmpG